MYKVELIESQYPSYLLSDETADSVATVVPTRGGIVTTWRWRGQEIFYLDQERFKDPQLSVRGGIPLLFPICGNLVEDTYTHNGQTYKLPQHGFARTVPWSVSQQKTTQGASITLTLKSNPTTKQVYPFDFELDFTYILEGNKLELIYGHRNLSQEDMPFATGIHPYFYVSNKEQLQLQIPSTEYQAKGDTQIQSFTGTFDFAQPEIDVAFINLSANQATVTDLERHLRLTLAYDDYYRTLVFWTVKDKDFYCLEPWSSPRNALNTGKDLIIAPPQTRVETKITMQVEPVN